MADNTVRITVELQPSFYLKTDPYTYQQVEKETIRESGEELLTYVKDEAPVRTGRLRDGHYIETRENWINIKNEVYYWKYVIGLGNDYINRGLLKFISDMIIEEKAMEQLKEMGLI